MSDMPLRIPSELSTPQNREKFFRHLLQDESQPLESRVQALAALVTLIEREAHEAGRRARELQRDAKNLGTSDTSVMYRAVRVAWDELQRKGHVSTGSRGATAVLEDEQLFTMFVSIVVRNALEDFHGDYIPDALMKEFNTIVRSAIYTALNAARSMSQSETASAWVASQLIHIPPYWEEPELLDGYVKSLKGSGKRLRRAEPSSFAQGNK